MGAIYSVVMADQTIIAAGELVTIRTASAIGTRASNIRILRAWVGQGATETSDQLGVRICLQASAFGTFTATTPVPHVVGGSASGISGGTAQAPATAGRDASANAAGTKTNTIVDGFSNVAGWLWVPTPEERSACYEASVEAALRRREAGEPTVAPGAASTGAAAPAAAGAGYHRRFGLVMRRFRGTEERPGLMLALDRGGLCRGMALRLDESTADDDLRGLWRREMVTGGYRPRWVNLKTPDGPSARHHLRRQSGQ